MDRELSLLASSIGFMFGCLIMIFAATLHANYAYGASYDNALHVPVPTGLVMLIGGVVAVLGLVGMAAAVLRKM